MNANIRSTNRRPITGRTAISSQLPGDSLVLTTEEDALLDELAKILIDAHFLWTEQ